ncbi:hypothetical protein [Nonomuraea gerenzanensis]|uniref:Uncharacterized protein n=1 Tax=Nonomuraea gerenzanensis TaxID=93944 RepID=A0A1M4DVW5_9ACTN|nr:hypothetical protein [Nonomuraea gerenzanensis]UBU13060.1 hypothetical protein LCN96_53955 [Nonomuraea gerenzanensis]SBO90702.1 hypothetical protein BN4615_P216 [Nonomuraea gerenzanensis]
MSAMSLVDRECVRQLLDSRHPDATLVFVRGDCVVIPAAEVDDAHRGLVIARRDEVLAQLPEGTPTDQMLDDLAVRLDNVVRDLGA